MVPRSPYTVEQLQGFLELIPDPAIAVDPDGTIVATNAHTRELLGDGEGLVGASFDAVVPGVPHGVRRRHHAAGVRMRRLNGSHLSVDISLAPVETADGRLTVVSLRDRSEYERLAVASWEAEYRSLVESASEVFYRVILDGDPLRGRVAFVSPQCEAVTGYGPEAFLADPSLWVELVHPEDRQGLFGSTQSILASGREGSRDYRLRDQRGDYHWMADHVVPLHDASGQLVGYQGAARDITTRVRVEEDQERLRQQLHEAQRLEAVGRLASGVAHDFNNLLTVISGNCEMLLLGSRDADSLHGELRDIAEASQRAAALTRQLLGLGGRQIAAPRALDVNRHLRGLEQIIRRTLRANVEIEWRLAEDLWPVWLDPAQLDQVAINLAANAHDSMPEGGRLAIETRNAVREPAFDAPNAEFAVLTVRDTGHGMDAPTRARALEPFFTTKSGGKGTGLGLATIHGIARQNGGGVEIDSRPGAGTAVSVFLPRHDGVPTSPPPRQVVAAIGGGERVIVVEDVLEVRRLACTLLRGLGYDVLEATSPAHARALLTESGSQVHLLLTDVVMPSMGGPDLAHLVASASPRTRTLFMSGYPPAEIADRGLLRPATKYLQKPFTRDELAAAVRSALGDDLSAARH